MKIVLFGAGSAQFGYGTLKDIFSSRVLSGAEIALVDINLKSLKSVHKDAVEYVASKGLNFKIVATDKADTALKDANFVIISIEVGDRFALWNTDWKIPMQFGVKQVYGENGGPGGIFHALRITPPILKICDSVARICPDAFVMNYSNPMTAITTTVLRRYPEMKFVGLCHEIASLERYLPAILDTKIDNLFYRAAGLNHFSVMLEARYKDSGRDAYKNILAKAGAFFESEPGYSEIWDYVRRTGDIPKTEGATKRWRKDAMERPVRPWSDRGLFRAILETYNLLPITTDSHLGEYVSWAGDVADHRGIQDFFDFYRHALSQEFSGSFEGDTHEPAVPIMEGILTNVAYEEKAVNVLNNGCIPDFPDSVAVEVPAVVDAGGLAPIKFESYPKGFGALIRSYSGVYDLTAEAILRGSRELVLQAVLACPVVNGFERMGDMVDYLLERQKDWLDYIKK